MQLVRYQYPADWAAGTFSPNCTLDTTVNISAYNHPALTPTIPLGAFNTATGAQTIGVVQPPGSAPLNHTGGAPTTLLILGSGLPPSAGPVTLPAFSHTNGLWTALDQLAYTSQVGDYLQFTTISRQVQVQFVAALESGFGLQAGQPGLVAGAIRNGAFASVTVDGVEQGPYDTSLNAAALISLDGASHVIRVTHTGYINASIAPVSAVTATQGITVATALGTPTALLASTFITATWQITATGATTYNLYRTLTGGSQTAVAQGLPTGAACLLIPGVTFTLSGSVPLQLHDSATFTTDVTMVAVASVGFKNSVVAAGSATYTSPVIAGGDPQTQWFLAEWTEFPTILPSGQPNRAVPPISPIASTSVPAFALATGNTPTPDATWTRISVTPSDVYLPVSKINKGVAGLAAAPRGAYAQFTLTFLNVYLTQNTPWVRDLTLSFWTPERDPAILAKVGVGKSWRAGPTLSAFTGTLNTFVATLRQAMLDFTGSYAITGAVDQYLQAYGADLGLPQYAAEPPQSYRTRLATAFQSRGSGGSPSFIAQQVAQLAMGVSTGVSTSVTNNLTTASCQGVIVRSLTGHSFQVIVPAPTGPYAAGSSARTYAGLPGLPTIQAHPIITGFIQLITPAGSAIPLPTNITYVP